MHHINLPEVTHEPAFVCLRWEKDRHLYLTRAEAERLLVNLSAILTHKQSV